MSCGMCIHATFSECVAYQYKYNALGEKKIIRPEKDSPEEDQTTLVETKKEPILS